MNREDFIIRVQTPLWVGLILPCYSSCITGHQGAMVVYAFKQWQRVHPNAFEMWDMIYNGSEDLPLVPWRIKGVRDAYLTTRLVDFNVEKFGLCFRDLFTEGVFYEWVDWLHENQPFSLYGFSFSKEKLAFWNENQELKLVDFMIKT